jgi:hypothetical protein
MPHKERIAPYKLFTVERANKALPLVRAIVADMSRLSREVIERRQRLAFLMDRRRTPGKDPYQEELNQVDAELASDGVRLQKYVEELRQLGVEPKSAAEGLVDFPAVLDGRLVYLCWRLGEPAVEYWHDLEAGFQGRQRLTQPAVTDAVGGSG